MVAGGVGLAPIYQIIQALYEDPTDQTQLHILFTNKSEEDIVMKEELDEAAKDPRIKVHHTITRVISHYFFIILNNPFRKHLKTGKD